MQIKTEKIHSEYTKTKRITRSTETTRLIYTKFNFTCIANHAIINSISASPVSHNKNSTNQSRNRATIRKNIPNRDELPYKLVNDKRSRIAATSTSWMVLDRAWLSTGTQKTFSCIAAVNKNTKLSPSYYDGCQP